MLQEFLNAQLISLTDDQQFSKLKKISDALSKTFQKNRAKTLTYVLTAFDPEISVENPEIIETKDLVTKSWNTFVTNSRDSPVTFIRAVILDALTTVSDDIVYACLIWQATRNLFGQYKLVGKEKEMLFNFLAVLGQKVDDVGTANWALQVEPKLQKLKLEISELVATIDRPALQNLLTWASGPNGSAGTTPFKDPNPHWPDSGQDWSFSFAQKATTAIANVVESAFKSQAEKVTAIQKQIQEGIVKVLTQTETEIANRNSSLQMRTQLLWWKEASYSNSLKKSYRSLNDGFMQLILAFDYASVLPFIYPASAEHFLIEAHNSLRGGARKQLKMSDILDLIYDAKEDLKIIFAEPSISSGRVTLLSFIQGLIWEKCKSDTLSESVGISLEINIELSEFCAWIFNDSLALKIVHSN